MGVEELAKYFGVPVKTIYDRRLVGTAPRAFKFDERLKFAVSDIQSWLAAHQEPALGAGSGSRSAAMAPSPS